VWKRKKEKKGSGKEEGAGDSVASYPDPVNIVRWGIVGDPVAANQPRKRQIGPSPHISLCVHTYTVTS
jgi:hypothetical protein